MVLLQKIENSFFLTCNCLNLLDIISTLLWEMLLCNRTQQLRPNPDRDGCPKKISARAAVCRCRYWILPRCVADSAAQRLFWLPRSSAVYSQQEAGTPVWPTSVG